MKNKNIVLIPMFLIIAMILSVLPLVNAATTMDSPVTSGNYTTTLNVSISVDANEEYNMTNVTCWWNMTGGIVTENDTYLLVDMANDSKTDLIFEEAVTISTYTDAITYNISCDVINGTNVNTTVSAASITFDSTNPICSLVRQSRTIAWKDTQLITWTSSDALSLVSTAVYIDRPEDGSTMPYTDENRALTLTSQDTKYIGDWTVNLTATDRAGNTCTPSDVTFKSYLPDGEIWEAGEPEEEKDIGKIWLLVVIVAVIVFFAVKGKKR